MPESSTCLEVNHAILQQMERRATVRYPCSFGSCCRFILASPTNYLSARVVDISQGGLALILNEPVRIDAVLAVDLRDSSGNLLRTLWLRVAHNKQLPDQRWVVGGAFIHQISNAELQTLLHYGSTPNS